MGIVHFNFYAYVCGILLFLMAQAIRAIRWQILLPSNLRIKKNSLLLFVSVGSLINFLIPFRLGDIIRAALLSRFEKVKFNLSISTLILERASDVVFVYFIYYLAYVTLPIETPFAGLWTLLLPLGLLLIWIGIKYIKRVRIFIYYFSSIWNPNIQITILDFAWCIFHQINSGKFLSRVYFLNTFLMWLLYFGAYYLFFISFPDLSLKTTIEIFQGDPTSSVVIRNQQLNQNPRTTFALFFFLLAPIVSSFLYSFFRRLFSKNRIFKNLFISISRITEQAHHGSPLVFSNFEPYRQFLLSFFTNNKGVLGRIGIKGFEDCEVVKVLPGGSNAITALVEKDNTVLIRKVANSNESDRLSSQFNWLLENHSHISLCKVNSWHLNANFCYYEMPYYPNSKDMYEWLHTVTIEESSRVLKQVLESIQYFHTVTQDQTPKNEFFNQFITSKVALNIELIRNTVSQFLDLEKFSINNTLYSFNEWDFLLEDSHMKILKHSPTSNIHGDLTIENIIVTPENKWFLIDSNSSQLWKSPLMDWGKLLQSLNKGYETLNRMGSCSYNDRSINFLEQRSDRYKNLHDLVILELAKSYGHLGIWQAKMHEIIHYLRLLPYKFSKNDESGMLFFAITCILIREFKANYGLN